MTLTRTPDAAPTREDFWNLGLSVLAVVVVGAAVAWLASL
jgi:preprotein translocase subunit SecE